jgi:hypothetical protein
MFSTSGNADGTHAARDLLITALLIALAASHGYMVLRVVVKHVLVRAIWKGNEEVEERETEEREVKEKFLKGLVGEGGVKRKEVDGRKVDRIGDAFWEHDEGLEEIQRISKEA